MKYSYCYKLTIFIKNSYFPLLYLVKVIFREHRIITVAMPTRYIKQQSADSCPFQQPLKSGINSIVGTSFMAAARTS